MTIIILAAVWLPLQAQEKPNYSLEFLYAKHQRLNKDWKRVMNDKGYGLGARYVQFLNQRWTFIGGLEYSRMYDGADWIREGQVGSKNDVQYQMDGLGFPVGFRLNLFNNAPVYLESSLVPEVLWIEESGRRRNSVSGEETAYRDRYVETTAYLSAAIGAQMEFGKMYLGIRPEFRIGTGVLEADGGTLRSNRYYRLALYLGF